MISYLDTNVILLLHRVALKSITKRAKQAIDRSELLISPMVMLELTYLHEIGRQPDPADAIFDDLYQSIDLRVCPLPYDRIVRLAAREAWTRDVFDRLIVSHAKAAGNAPLISSDEVIASHYPNTIW